MKSKRVFGLVLALIAAVCLTVSFNARSTARAATDLGEIKKITGHNYDITYLMENAGLEKIDEDSATVIAGRFVRITEKDGVPIEAEPENGTDGTDGSETSDVPGASETPETPQSKKLVSRQTFESTNAKVEFFAEGVYTFEVYKGGNPETDEQSELEATFTVATTNMAEKGSLSYATDPETLSKFNELVDEALKNLVVGDSITMPSFDTVIKSEYFAYGDLTKTIYYASSQTGSYTSTSSTKFKITTPGIYSFYVIATDPCANKITTDDLIEGPDGWYEKDEDGNRVGEVVIPIFTFTVSSVTTPKITVETSENGFLNLEYKVDCFTVDAVEYSSEYKLYYCKEEPVKESDFDDFDAFSKALIQKIDQMDDVTEELLNTSTMRFTPNKKGYYYVYLRAVDSNNLSEAVMSRPIEVSREFREVKLENEFLKNNIVSVICLSISAVCFIAIIIILISGAVQKKRDGKKAKK